jgi:hypothetical protein
LSFIQNLIFKVRNSSATPALFLYTRSQITSPGFGFPAAIAAALPEDAKNQKLRF